MSWLKPFLRPPVQLNAEIDRLAFAALAPVGEIKTPRFSSPDRGVFMGAISEMLEQNF